MITAEQVRDILKQKFPYLRLKVVDASLQLKKENCFGVCFWGEYDSPEIIKRSLKNFCGDHLEITAIITHVRENKK